MDNVNRRLHLVCGGLALAACFLGGPSAASPPEVRIKQGALRGLEADGVSVFRGIPFAAPPVEGLRWRPPQPAPAWSGVRDALVAGNDCLQSSSVHAVDPSGRPVSEDCLYLNVWSPERRERLPIIVWIHGGGFVTGSGARGMTDGRSLAQRGVVVVSINYRLGRLGFFAHPLLTAEAPEAPLANYGLMDQIAALEWVRDNIASFGGDSDNVTLMGESAGGASVNFLMASPAARGLFHKAIVISGGGRTIPPAYTPDLRRRSPDGHPSAEQIGEAALARAGRWPRTAAELRATPWEALRLPPEAGMSGTVSFPGVVVDGRVVTAPVAEAFARGEAMVIPYLIGANDAEGILFADQPGRIEQALSAFGDQRAAIERAYGDRRTARRHLGGDVVFVEPARHLARLMRDRGAPVRVYRFGYVAESLRARLAGLPHAYSLPYFFDRLEASTLPASAADSAVATLTADYVAAFARAGDPNGEGRVRWPEFGSDESLLFIESTGVRAGDDPTRARLDLVEAAALRLVR